MVFYRFKGEFFLSSWTSRRFCFLNGCNSASYFIIRDTLSLIFLLSGGIKISQLVNVHRWGLNPGNTDTITEKFCFLKYGYGSGYGLFSKNEVLKKYGYGQFLKSKVRSRYGYGLFLRHGKGAGTGASKIKFLTRRSGYGTDLVTDSFS